MPFNEKLAKQLLINAYTGAMESARVSQEQ